MHFVKIKIDNLSYYICAEDISYVFYDRRNTVITMKNDTKLRAEGDISARLMRIITDATLGKVINIE